MRLHLGRRYRRRDGKVSSPVTAAPLPSGEYPFLADGHTYTGDGHFNATGLPSSHDLVGRVEPQAADKLMCDMTLEDYRRGIRNIASRPD